MPKLKIHQGTKKRVRVTRNGKVLRRHSTANHFLRKKSKSRKRQFAGVEELSNEQSKKIKRRLGL